MDYTLNTKLDKEINNILGTLARIYAKKGDAKKVAVLAISKHEIEYHDGGYFNNEEYHRFKLNLELPLPIYTSLKSEINELQNDFLTDLSDLLRKYSNEDIFSIEIFPKIIEDVDWKEKATIWLEGGKINNQGRVRSDNIASRICDGLLFRSNPEILLYKSLKKMGVTFAPLPVFLRGGKTYKRIEPDFFVVKDGVSMIIEVDGDTVHQETPAEAHARITLLIHEGVKIERIKSSDCDTQDKADNSAERILKILDKVKGNK